MSDDVHDGIAEDETPAELMPPDEISEEGAPVAVTPEEAPASRPADDAAHAEASIDTSDVAAEAEQSTPMIDAADAVFVEAVRGGLTWVPFAAYLGLWIVLAGTSAYLLYGASADQPARWMPEYVPLLWTGVGLTALGPVLSVIVWLFARLGRSKPERRGLFASAMTRGALAAFFGVAIWVATLFVLELVASGGAL